MEESKKNNNFDIGGDKEILYSKTIKAGKRIYYIDVKKSSKDDLFIAITESKRIQGKSNSDISFEKHKIFLYKEDFDRFVNVLKQVMDYANEYQPNRAQQANKVVEKPNDIDDRLSISIDDFDLESGDKPSE